MNIVLFEAGEVEAGYLPNGDARVEHLRRVLRREAGDEFDAGVIDGMKGKAKVESYGEETMSFSFRAVSEEPKLFPIDLIVGLSRPQTNRKILNEATTLGVRSIRFVVTERGEPSYADSKLWSSGEWRRHVIAGAAQAFSTRLPLVTWGMSLEEGLKAATGREEDGAASGTRLALDNYEATEWLGKAVAGRGGSVALAVGSERGWTAAERNVLRSGGWTLVGLGDRVLRTETAVVAAVSVVLGVSAFAKASSSAKATA